MQKRSTSYADLQGDWRNLLDRIGQEVPESDEERTPLSKSLNELQELRGIQMGLVAARRRITQRLWEVKAQGKEQARRLKGLLTWHGGAGDSREAKSPESPLPGTRAAKLKDWQRLVQAMQEADLPHLESHRAQLKNLLHEAEDLIQAQAALTTVKQGATKQLAELLADGQRLATVLKLSLRQHYGPAAEKLEDFGIQPFQGRKKHSAVTGEVLR